MELRDQLTLGEFIKVLERMPGEADVQYDCGYTPDGTCSWRGNYSELAFGHSHYSRTIHTVADVLRDAREAIGREFNGWKGGEYTMTEKTPVWADASGESCGQQIVGARVMTDGDNRTVVVIETQNEDYEPDSIDNLQPVGRGQRIWFAYFADFSGFAVFADEMEALRYAVENGMKVKTVETGKDLREQAA